MSVSNSKFTQKQADDARQALQRMLLIAQLQPEKLPEVVVTLCKLVGGIIEYLIQRDSEEETT